MNVSFQVVVVLNKYNLDSTSSEGTTCESLLIVHYTIGLMHLSSYHTLHWIGTNKTPL